jgi:DNA-binding CsgD family transcriptional regulator
MQAILRRHRAARGNLELRHNELAAEQEMLNETHTTLNILLAARREERQRFEKRVQERFASVLGPLVAGLENTALNARQRILLDLIKDVIGHIVNVMPADCEGLQTPFTAKERMLAYLFSTGQKPREMAYTLGISRRTVQNHCQRMRIKAGLKGSPTTLEEWLTRRRPDVRTRHRRSR